MVPRARPVVLIILDGWGYTESKEYNAIYAAHTPTWDRLWRECPHTLLRASSTEVGLPAGQMGNSEVGHLNLGAGRIVYQDITRISLTIEDESFFRIPLLVDMLDQLAQNGRALHIFGLLSPGGVHSHENQIHALVELANLRKVKKIYLHAFLDGRDTQPVYAEKSIRLMEKEFIEHGGGEFATICGRFYAMDRDKRWERTEQAYHLLTLGEANFSAPTAIAGLKMGYQRKETDEFIKPTIICPEGRSPIQIEDGDSVIYMNYRADRARQLTRAFIARDFDDFERRARPKLSQFVTLTKYHKDFDVPVVFPKQELTNALGEYLSSHGLRQLRIAETEKYAHVTFFFNGGVEPPYEGEDRILVPSPRVATYDLQPEMSAADVTTHLIQAVTSDKYDLIVCNYANPDMVGHTGFFDAAVKAIETVDHCLGEVITAIDQVGGEILITADHGNAELMQLPNGQPNTAHTTNLTPLLYRGRKASFVSGGALCDVAPTLLRLIGLEQPPEMTGRSLIDLEDEKKGNLSILGYGGDVPWRTPATA